MGLALKQGYLPILPVLTLTSGPSYSSLPSPGAIVLRSMEINHIDKYMLTGVHELDPGNVNVDSPVTETTKISFSNGTSERLY